METSVVWGTLFSIVAMALGFVVECAMMQKVNAGYDLESCTKKQRFIAFAFAILSSFAIVISVLMVQQGMIVPLFMLWMFLCGFGHYLVGFVLNMRIFSRWGMLSMGVAFVLFTVSLVAGDLGSTQSLLFYLAQRASFLTLGVVPVLIALKLRERA